MKTRSISASSFNGLKIWAPVVNTAIFLGFVVWYVEKSLNLIPILDYVVLGLLSVMISQVWWVAIVLKRIEIEGDILHISGLNRAISVPTSEIVDVRDQTRFSIMPSTIVLGSVTEFGRNIRFFSTMSTHATLAHLRQTNEERIEEC